MSGNNYNDNRQTNNYKSQYEDHNTMMKNQNKKTPQSIIGGEYGYNNYNGNSGGSMGNNKNYGYQGGNDGQYGEEPMMGVGYQQYDEPVTGYHKHVSSSSYQPHE